MRQLDNTRLAHQIMFSKLENFASKKDDADDEKPKKKKKGFFRRHPVLTTLGALTAGGLAAYGLGKTPLGKLAIEKAKSGLNSKFGDKDWYKSAKETYHKAGDLAAKGVDKAKNLAGKAKNKVSDSIYNKFYKKRTDAAVADAEDKLIKDREDQLAQAREAFEDQTAKNNAEWQKKLEDIENSGGYKDKYNKLKSESQDEMDFFKNQADMEKAGLEDKIAQLEAWKDANQKPSETSLSDINAANFVSDAKKAGLFESKPIPSGESVKLPIPATEQPKVSSSSPRPVMGKMIPQAPTVHLQNDPGAQYYREHITSARTSKERAAVRRRANELTEAAKMAAGA